VTSPLLDPSFNIAILEITRRVLPRGFDVSFDAPSSYEDLHRLLVTGARLRVWAGASDKTIYGDPEINHAFRAWHDWSHWIARQPFTPRGERAVSAAQCRHLLIDYGDNAHTRRWQLIIDAEVVGQNEYQARYQRFPADQAGFVTAYLDHPTRALAWPSW
jgi:hypothetical protein